VCRASTLSVALIACASAVAGAQDVRVAPGRANWSATGTTVTATFMVENGTTRGVQARPRIDLPPTWRLVTGNAPLDVGAGESGLLIISAMVPVKTVAGSYQIRLAVLDADNEKYLDSDSIRIAVEPRRALDVALVNHPSFIISGRSYDAEFTVRNRGNVPASVELRARSSMGSAALAEPSFQLEPDESRMVRIRVNKATTGTTAADDVVELIAKTPGDATTQRRASARVTVVPRASTTVDDFQRVPTQLALRAANASGVSPFVLTGSGLLRDGRSERVDFLFRGSPGPSSMFGDRDEYRVDFRSPTWRVRAGDHLFLMSPLTGGSQAGMGLEVDKRLGTFGVGGYTERFRRTPGNSMEAGAFVSATPTEGVRLALNGVGRSNGALSGQLGSFSTNIQRGGVAIEAEVAGSADSTGTTGLGHMLHASGERRGVSFDLGHSKADEAFIGPLRGAQHDYLSASASPTRSLSFMLSGSSHTSTDRLLFGLRSQDKLRLGSAGVTFASLVSIEGVAAQHVRRFGTLSDERQTSVRARLTPVFGHYGATLSAETGHAQPDSVTTRAFTDVSLNVGMNSGLGGISVFAEHYSGGSVMRGVDPTLSVGGSGSLRFGGTFDAGVIATANRLGTAVPYWISNVDAQVSHVVRNGATVTLRARVMQGGFGLATATPAVAYLEYSMPIGVPVSRLRTPGRAIGQVIDAATGRGVANTLVRLGPQVGITDRNGRVSFGGLPAGDHRVSLAQETSYADAVFIGNAVLRMDTSRAAPKHFMLKLARSARIELSARRFAVSRTGIAGSADSIVDVGPLTGTGFRLIGERDTLYRLSDENGRVAFTDIAPGKWLIEADGDVPSFHRFDPEKIPVDLVPGETRAVSFRLVPRPREVKIMNQSEEVHAIPAEPRGAANPNAPKTSRPQVLQPQRQQRQR
jgi:hypothetical protein